MPPMADARRRRRAGVSRRSVREKPSGRHVAPGVWRRSPPRPPPRPPWRLSFNGLDGIAPTSCGLLLDAQKGFTFVVDCTQAKEFALAHWLINGADGGRLFVRCFDGRGDAAGDVLASLTTMVWNADEADAPPWPTPR